MNLKHVFLLGLVTLFSAQFSIASSIFSDADLNAAIADLKKGEISDKVANLLSLDLPGAGFGLCVQKGYSPSSCKKSAKLGYGLCINKGYSPSSCDSGDDSIGFGICVMAGYSPSSCGAGTMTKGPGFGMCVAKGYSPSSCAAGSDLGFGLCVMAGYSPSSCN